MINSKGIVVGWGITEENVPSNDAKFINSPVIDGEVCTDSHFGYYEIKGTTTFCAGIPNSNMNPCKGDSGGPFIYFNQKAKRFYLRGIVSTGLVLDRNKECDGSLYSLYSDVSKSTSWIKDLINVYG
jgi:secreted trypsin-like serine protease